MNLRFSKNFMLFLLAAVLMNGQGMGQVRSGAAFLKVLPGARIQSMAGTAGGVIDDPHAVFANPAAAAFFREWEWSAGYTKWIADISNASFIYGKKVPMPWSRDFRLGFGLVYQGISTFNNNSSVMPEASASDVVASISLGQPLSFLSKNISVGANIKYLNSVLAQYSTSSLIYDYGILAKTRSVKLGKNLQGLFTLGASVTQNGRDLTYIQLGTPLPRTVRVGGAVYLGSHNNMRTLLAADYVNVRDEEPYVSIGAELRINRFLAVDAGYDFGSDLFKKVTFGASIRMDDVSMPLGEAFPGKHNAFRFDFATLDASEYFSRTYRGAITHFTSRPEPFQLVAPVRGDSLSGSNFILRWQSAREPDIFDEVIYRVLVDRDSSNIASIIRAYEENSELFWALLENPMILNKETKDTFMPMGVAVGGNYYWTVVAIDQDKQVRFAANSQNAVPQFAVVRSDIELQAVQFEYNPYITMDDYHGRIIVRVKNSGDQTVNNIVVRLKDDIEQLDYNTETLAYTGNDVQVPRQRINDYSISVLRPGEEKKIEMEWRTPLLGRHKITAIIDPDGNVNDHDRLDNEKQTTIFTTPKGSFAAVNDAPEISVHSEGVMMPMITRIAFDENSAAIKKEYLANNVSSVLPAWAQRLCENPDLSIRLKGCADPNSGETEAALGRQRAEAVKKMLQSMGVASDQIVLLAGHVLPKRAMPADSADSEMLRQERRCVQILTSADAQRMLLQPLYKKTETVEQANMQFRSDIASSIPLTSGEIMFVSDAGKIEKSITVNEQKLIPDFSCMLGSEISPQWFDSEIEYSLSIQDSLGRTFQTNVNVMHLKQEKDIKKLVLHIPFEFGATEPSSDAAWQGALETARDVLQNSGMRIRIEGHACAIGSEKVNETISKVRAEAFEKQLKRYLRSRTWLSDEEFLKRIDAPVGRGETRPLMENGGLLSANDSPLKRQLNRRIEVVFYNSEDS